MLVRLTMLKPSISARKQPQSVSASVGCGTVHHK